MIWFKNEGLNIMVGIETDSRPIIGDKVKIKEEIYTVQKVLWELNEPPYQSGIIAYIV